MYDMDAEMTRPGDDAKRLYLEKNWELVRDNVEFTRELDEADFKAMEVLQWLPKQNDLPTTVGYYNEQARKFLIEGKPKAAKLLLE